MPELRKRPAPKETATPAPTAKRSASKPRTAAGAAPSSTTAGTAVGKVKKAAAKVKGAVLGDADTDTNVESKPTDEISTVGEIPETVGAGTAGTATEESKAEEDVGAGKKEVVAMSDGTSKGTATLPLNGESVGKKVALDGGMGGTVKTHTGDDITLTELLNKSDRGIVLFTYPKASTPGCTTQACLFRDSYAPLRDAGLSVFGLSTDSPKANTTFATKQKLPFDLLCDPEAGLTGALGLKKSVGKGTLRGSVVIVKDGTVESWTQAGPAKTLEVVMDWVNGKK